MPDSTGKVWGADITCIEPDEARAAVFDYMEVFYNRVRLHAPFGYLNPEQFEASRCG